MKRLNCEAFGRAQAFLKTEARPLEGALFAYRFEGAAAGKVLSELAHFQNEDGGFGRALEPDLRTPSSSALATGIGLRLLKELQCPAGHRMVQRAVDYLRSTFDQQHKVWRVAPADTNEYPHAGWWHDEDGSLARTFDDFRIIPRAELMGLLHHFSAAVPAQWLDVVTEATVSYIETVAALGTGGGDDLAGALSLAETEVLARPFKERLVSRIRAVVPQVVNRRPQEWATYCITPLKVAPSPRSLAADLLWDDLQVQLDYEIEHQSETGTWDPVWTWEDLYPQAWAQAKLEWRGHLTLEALTVLRAFGRIEI